MASEARESALTEQPRLLYVRTFGCQMNERDSEAAIALLGARGYEAATRPEDADVVLVQTCSVREGAEHKVWSLLGELRRFKLANPRMIVAVGGCVAQRHGATLLARAPKAVDLVLGTGALGRLADLVEKARAGEGPIVDTSRFEGWAEVEPRAQGPTAYVTVQRGCDRRCRFCIVPDVRGREVDRPPADVLGEVRRRAGRGAREVTLIGQNITSYRARDEDGGAWRLAELLRASASTEGVERVRFLTAHPLGIDDDLVRLLAEVPEVSPHVHLPVQSGSDRVLRAMGRGHGREAYLATVRRLRAARPGIAVTTDLIVGFPGETPADFEDTLGLVREAAFEGAYCFKYSPRPGTRAHAWGDPVPKEEKARRLAALQGLTGEFERRSNEATIGREETILVTGPSKDGKGVTGRTGSHKIVNAPGDPATLAGRLVRVRVLDAGAHSLRGLVVGIVPCGQAARGKGPQD